VNRGRKGSRDEEEQLTDEQQLPMDDAGEMMQVLKLNLHEGRMRQCQDFDGY